MPPQQNSYKGNLDLKPSLTRIIEFQKLLEQFNDIDRVVHRQHGSDFRPENDTEHSYNLAMTALFLAPYFPELDSKLLIKLALIHDLVEIHAGDTYIYGSAAELATKQDREHEAAQKLLHDWPDFPELHELIKLYEARQKPEATFVYALDKVMPILQIYIHGGYSWEKEGVTVQMLIDNKLDKVALSPEIKPYFDDLIALLETHPRLIKRR